MCEFDGSRSGGGTPGFRLHFPVSVPPAARRRPRPAPAASCAAARAPARRIRAIGAPRSIPHDQHPGQRREKG